MTRTGLGTGRAGDAAPVVVIGAGPAGSALALYLLRLGVRPLIVEAVEFPRYHIGESLTGECGNCLRELGLAKHMEQAGYPVKGGVTVWGATGKNRFRVPVQQRDHDGNLASATTWQVRRPEFDQALLETARRRGAELVRGTARRVLRENGAVTGVEVQGDGGRVQSLRARVVADASGQASFLARHRVTSSRERGNYSKQVAFFTQVRGALRDPAPDAGNTLIFYAGRCHWAWFIPLDETVTSVGVVVPSEAYKGSGAAPGAFLEMTLASFNPELSRRLHDVEWVAPVRSASNYSYRIEQFTGPGYLCVGDAHRFIDPIFSFGAFFAIKEASFAADAIQAFLAGESAHLPNPFLTYQTRVERGQDVIQSLVDTFWRYPLAFQMMVHHSHAAEMVDLFAGRIYADDGADNAAVSAMRGLLSR